MTLNALTRRFTISFYLLWIFIILAALIETFAHGAYFHLIIFLPYMLAYIIGLYLSMKYRIDTEKSILKICLFFGACNIVAVSLLIGKKDLAWIIRTWIIEFTNIMWLVYRYYHLKHIIDEANKIKQGEIRWNI